MEQITQATANIRQTVDVELPTETFELGELKQEENENETVIYVLAPDEFQLDLE